MSIWKGSNSHNVWHWKGVPSVSLWKEHQDYLRFLWWDKGDLDSLVYRMKVHLFGEASSPRCSSFGDLELQGHGRVHQVNPEKLLHQQWHNKCLLHHLLKPYIWWKSQEPFRPHKFVSNKKEVIATIPPEEHARTTDLDMALGELHIEQTLGVQ